MKKIIIMVSVLLFCLTGFTSVSADSSTNLYPSMAKKPDVKMYKLYKQVILTRHQIQEDYTDWEKINKRIEKYFISLYFKTDRNNRLKEIEKKMGDMIIKYDNKILNSKQEKALNIIKNLYYRAEIDLTK